MRFSFRSILAVLAILAGILTAVAFSNDIPSRIEKGHIGHKAIKLLDATRRPFLAVKQAEFTFINQPQNRKAEEKLPSAIADGRRLLARFLDLADYEHELKLRVQRLSELFENWAADEKRFFEISGLPREVDEKHVNMALYHRQLIKLTDGFLGTMAALGDAEIPIHKTTHNGDSALKDLQLLAGLFITMMIIAIMLLIYQRPRELAVMVKQRTADLNKAVEDLENEIAERKRMEKTLKESEKRYRDLVTNLPDAVIIHREGKILFVNNAALSLVGAKKPEELLGKNILDFVPPSYLEKVKKRIANVTEGKKAPLSEGKLFRFDGNQIDIEVVGIPIEYEGEKGIQSIIRDITVRKKAEEKAQIHRSRLNTIIDSSSDIIFLKNKNSRYLIVNKATEKFFSIHAEHMIGKTDFDLMPAEHAVACRESDTLALQSQDSIRREEYTMNRWLDVVKRAVRDEDGNVTGIVGVIRDITERKTAEEKLKKSVKTLERFNRLAVGREARMVEMKSEVNALLKELGRKGKYAVDSLKYDSSGSRKSEPTL